MLTDDERAILRAADLIRARPPAQAALEVPTVLPPLSFDEEEAFRVQGEQAQELSARARLQAAEDRRALIKGLKELARMESPPDPRPMLETADGWTAVGVPGARYFCWECRAPIFGEVTIVGIHALCVCCNARHRLKCDQCGAHGGDVLTSHCSDHAWRCDKCLSDIQPVPAERRMRVALVARW